MSGQRAKLDYDRISQHYDSHRTWDETVPRRLFELAAGQAVLEQSAPLLEIGCGTGNLTHWLLKFWRGPVIGLDASRGMLAQAHPKLARAWLLRADATALPLRDGVCHGAIGAYVLHHLDASARGRLFRRLRAVLRENAGGVAFLTTTHAQIRSVGLSRWFPSFAAIDCARFPDLPVLMAELREAGFDSIGSEAVGRHAPRGDARYLEKVKSRFISTFELLPLGEFDRGLASMEQQLARDGHLGDVSWRGTIVHARPALCAPLA